MSRIVKDPEERRQELLACAMRLFAENGYDNVSVRAVARAAGVAPGLAYHYFDSKERMFAEAIEDYACRCARIINEVLDDRALSLEEQLDRAFVIGLEPGRFSHEGFFHAQGNGALHDRLSLALCEAVRPHLRAALERDAALRGTGAADADVLASMMVYSCIGSMSEHDSGDGSQKALRRYLLALIGAFRAQEGAAP